MLIIFGGLPATGKTTLARGLARDLGAVHVRVDSIEGAIRTSGVRVVSLDDAGYRVGYAVAEDNLRLGHVVIADSVNPLRVTRQAWREVAERARVTAVEVEIQCSDVNEHKARVGTRSSEVAGVTAPTWEAVRAREYDPWERPHVIVDTARQTVDESLIALRSALSTNLPPGAAR
jgi:predicted kinase